jgi:prolyl oligopeptidase
MNRRSRLLPVAALLAAALALPAPLLASDLFEYPPSERGDVVDDYHGTKVADPYRWLEEDARTSFKVASWIEDENALTFSYLSRIPERGAIRERLTKLWDYERFGLPEKAGDRYYYSRNDGLQNQSVVYSVESLDAEPVEVINPNAWTEDGTEALNGEAFSPDGRYLAYARSRSGSDWRVWYVKDLSTGEDLPEKLDWIKWSSAAWTADSKGFFYGRFPQPEEGKEFQSLNLNARLYYHRVGTSQSEDVLAYERPDQPEWGFGTEVSEDGRYLVIGIWKGTDDNNMLVYRDLSEPYGAPVTLIPDFANVYSFLGNDGSTFYFRTDLDAPLGRVIAIDVDRPARGNWREILPQSENALRSAALLGNLFVAEYLKDAASQIRVFRMDGTWVRDVDLPGIGTADGFDGSRKDFETFYSFGSFNRPDTVYRYDLLTGKSTVWKQPEVAFNPDDYVVKQVFYESKDGTRIPMFISHRKGVKLDGSNPTLLYGYGGFNIPMRPQFSITRLAWMEMGGVYAVANLRGGGEYGEEWHKAGTRLQKQNVFDDFIAAAEHLISSKYTRKEKLAIFGGSNGGLLVGAVMTQRPDLFGAALPAVGVMDMLRFQKFTAGRYWTDDYGSSDDPAEFQALLAYSPYHNLKKGTTYPPTLITTADTDDRVVPGHSFKFAAELQKADSGKNPQLIRIQTKAGHGAGKPTKVRIEEYVDMWGFLVRNLDMELTGEYRKMAEGGQ